MTRFIQALLCCVLLLGGYAIITPRASAELSIDITKSEFDPVPIAIPDFVAGDGRNGQLGKDFAEVIKNNLERSGLFDVLDPAGFPAAQTDIRYRPNFNDWRVIRAEGLVSGRITQTAADRLEVEYRLWDVYGQEQIDGFRTVTTPENWRRMAHTISDSIYKRLTGEEGYFDSRIVYISETGGKVDRVKKLAIMDQDGANHGYLLGGDSLVLTPRFAPNAQKIAYLSYESGRPEVYLMDIATNRREKLGVFEGMTTSPRFSPDGRKLLFTQIKRGNSDIYVYDIATRTVTALTSAPGIDTSPSFSPDGRSIAFNSDRGGRPQIYKMNADGSNVKRVSFGDGRYTAPIWSPRGDKIAFTKSSGGRFHIGVMNTDGSKERLLTDSYLDEGPTWSPNGRVVLFTREGQGAQGRSAIWSVDLTGRNLRRIATPSGASDPAWSPILPKKKQR